ncbi:hypothetical protein OF83DRAFT_630710 [Amylostereum chailletii]|nr:hypothetical protein OF83DRAFT_630710 [Amylostereum chailletii]
MRAVAACARALALTRAPQQVPPLHPHTNGKPDPTPASDLRSPLIVGFHAETRGRGRWAVLGFIFSRSRSSGGWRVIPRARFAGAQLALSQPPHIVRRPSRGKRRPRARLRARLVFAFAFPTGSVIRSSVGRAKCDLATSTRHGPTLGPRRLAFRPIHPLARPRSPGQTLKRYKASQTTEPESASRSTPHPPTPHASLPKRSFDPVCSIASGTWQWHLLY